LGRRAMGRTHRTDIKTTRPEIPKSTVYKNIVRANRETEEPDVEPYDADKELMDKFIEAGIINENN